MPQVASLHVIGPDMQWNTLNDGCIKNNVRVQDARTRGAIDRDPIARGCRGLGPRFEHRAVSDPAADLLEHVDRIENALSLLPNHCLACTLSQHARQSLPGTPL